ncbi:unnamed protein product [Thelazia callipaeda]|uniref:DUF1768 domain-containing protein n=1 Tax=Thelazia callipaeda TaxID=103827 RepID=A0A0N5D4H7_THECL|nr:unnamed protein product [Thelazia callipaeda]
MTNIVTTESGEKFTLFYTIRSPFSNFHPCRFTICEDIGTGEPEKRWYYSTEQYYMFHKALFTGDTEAAEQIASERNARKIKMISRNIKNFEREAWSKVSGDVMRKGNYAKYTQNPVLRKKLFYTYGSTLVECSPTDLEWGIGLDINEPDALSPTKWRGKNKLGHILTEIREELLLKPEYAQEVSDILSMLENFESFSRQFFIPPKHSTQQFSHPSAGDNNRNYEEKRSLPSPAEITNTDEPTNKCHSLSSYPCAELSDNVIESHAISNSSVENDSTVPNKERHIRVTRLDRKRNYHRLSHYDRDYSWQHRDVSRDHRESSSQSRKKREVSNNRKSCRGSKFRSNKYHSNSDCDSSRSFKRQQKNDDTAVHISRSDESRHQHDRGSSFSDSDHSSISTKEASVVGVKKAHSDPFKNLLERLRSKRCGMWEHCKLLKC